MSRVGRISCVGRHDAGAIHAAAETCAHAPKDKKSLLAGAPLLAPPLVSRRAIHPLLPSHGHLDPRGLTPRRALSRWDQVTLRFLHYPPCDWAGGAPPVRCGAHTDFGLFTFLFVLGGEEGLQVKRVEGSTVSDTDAGSEHGWRAASVPGDEPCCIINTGALTARWTDEHYRATAHRVVVPSAEAAGRHRYSIAFFVDPDTDAVVRAARSPGGKGDGEGDVLSVEMYWAGGEKGDGVGGVKEEARLASTGGKWGRGGGFGARRAFYGPPLSSFLVLLMPMLCACPVDPPLLFLAQMASTQRHGRFSTDNRRLALNRAGCIPPPHPHTPTHPPHTHAHSSYLFSRRWKRTRSCWHRARSQNTLPSPARITSWIGCTRHTTGRPGHQPQPRRIWPSSVASLRMYLWTETEQADSKLQARATGAWRLAKTIARAADMFMLLSLLAC